MKLQYRILLIFVIFGSYLTASEYQGQVVFYSYTEKSTSNQDQVEIDSDFSYHVGGILKYLDEDKIKYQIIYKSNFTIITINGKKLRIRKKQIPTGIGYIMIKNNGKYLISNGIGTDADMISKIYHYFGIKY